MAVHHTISKKIPTIIQETGENAADQAHSVTVHGRPTVPENEMGSLIGCPVYSFRVLRSIVLLIKR